MSTVTANELPSITWKQPREGITRNKYPTQAWLSWFGIWAWLVVRICIHNQINRSFNLGGLLVECALDPVYWGLFIWMCFADKKITESSIAVGSFDCPHCGEGLLAHEKTLKAPIGYISRCALCNNSFVKRSAPKKIVK